MGKYRWVILSVVASITILLLGLAAMFSCLQNKESNILQLAFNLLTPYQWVITGVTSIIAVATYLFVLKIYDFLKMKNDKEDDNDEN